jgi:nicotinamide phosphoribosyltransferase
MVGWEVPSPTSACEKAKFLRQGLTLCVIADNVQRMNYLVLAALRFILATDGYKLDHRRQYPKLTQWVLSNLTARKGRDATDLGVVYIGLQGFLQGTFHDDAQAFFDCPKQLILDAYQDFLDNFIGPNDIGTEHIGALHDLGYIPLEFRSLPEGTFVPYGVPMMTMENTIDEFYWVVNYFESALSSAMWMPITSATTARRFRRLLEGFAERTSDREGFVPFQAHDFSFRGMSSVEAAAASGFGHLTSFTGSDNLPANIFAREFYDATGFISAGVPATEHAVMCAGGDVNELETFRYLLNLYKTGIVSIVSDTWNLWHVLTSIVVDLKELIMSRDGTLVIRPDSGDPADIICGDPKAEEGTPEWYGVYRLLDQVFGHTVNSKGYKALDSHVNVIYGDSITEDRATDIGNRLEAMGYAVEPVLGVGSYTYQYKTRDNHNMAVKATAARVDGVERMLFKDPITDYVNGVSMKKSAKGRLAVVKGADGLKLVDQLTKSDWEKLEDANLLVPVWRDGEFLVRTNLEEIRARVAA